MIAHLDAADFSIAAPWSLSTFAGCGVPPIGQGVVADREFLASWDTLLWRASSADVNVIQLSTLD